MCGDTLEVDWIHPRKKGTMRIMVTIRLAVCLGAVAALMGVPAAQETKPVPKDSVRVSIPG